MKWWGYIQNLYKECALGCKMAPQEVDYGEIIYQSAAFPDRRWLVANYNGEFNVFVEQLDYRGRPDRKLAATFKHKERAISFAMKMFLVCCGRLRRADTSTK